METRKEKILIVDDLPKNIQLLGSILREKGYDIAFAKNGHEAMSRVANNKFDLILLDIMMPEMDGFEVCKALKNDDNTAEIPIIFLTAKNDTESTVKGFDLGAVDYVTKPFNSTELLARVKTHLALKSTNEKLTEYNKKLIELNATKDKFFSIIAHDLRNPLVSFKGLTDLLINNYGDFDEEEKLKFISSMNKSAKQLFSLFDNLLEWSRIQTGRIKFVPVDFVANPIIEQVIALHEASLNAKNITLINQISNQELLAYGDKQMFATILRNLLSNAVKFTNNGGEIKIDAILQNHEIVFSIADNGIGMTEAEITSLFRIEEHISKPGTDNEKGTGLGLILCKEFIEKNQGKIWVQSKLNFGSVFNFTFPAKS